MNITIPAQPRRRPTVSSEMKRLHSRKLEAVKVAAMAAQANATDTPSGFHAFVEIKSGASSGLSSAD